MDYNNEQDKIKFAQIMKVISEIFQIAPLSKEKLLIYFRTMQKYSIEQVEKAGEELVCTKIYKSFPVPAEFIQIINKEDDIESLEAWEEVQKAVLYGGSYKTIGFENGITGAVVKNIGFLRLCNMTDENEPFLKREFISTYNDFKKTNKSYNGLLNYSTDKEKYIVKSDKNKVELLEYQINVPGIQFNEQGFEGAEKMKDSLRAINYLREGKK